MIRALKITLFLSFLLTLTRGEAACFREHVKEGRQLNKERKALYSDWAQGHKLKRRARVTSNAFIALETAMLPMARIYDLKARKYQASGLFCDDFISISETPDFTTINAQIPSTPYIHKLKFIATFEDQVKSSLRKKDWREVRAHALDALEHFPAKETHCLTRHFVESLGRLAALAPRHIRLAFENDLGSPSKLISSMIKFHLFGLGYAQKIDSLAAPLQYKGIPIVCQDVPNISIPELTH